LAAVEGLCGTRGEPVFGRMRPWKSGEPRRIVRQVKQLPNREADVDADLD
jgi:hypothetical protein